MKPSCETCVNPHNKDWRKELKLDTSVRKPECGTCTNARNKCPRYNDAIEETPCILHPQAREYLMADVLEELELNYQNDRGIDYHETIRLIKNGGDGK